MTSSAVKSDVHFVIHRSSSSSFCAVYLHVDAQGHDLEVLMGLGDQLKLVKEGCIEMPLDHSTKLYKIQESDYFLPTTLLKEGGGCVTRPPVPFHSGNVFLFTTTQSLDKVRVGGFQFIK
jgi:hypothetical protein